MAPGNLCTNHRTACICGLGRSAALQILAMATAMAAGLRLAAHPDPQRTLAARSVQRLPRGPAGGKLAGMAITRFSPPYVPATEVARQLRDRGYAVLAPQDAATWVDAPLAQLQSLRADWDDLPPDEHLRDGGRYRRRRHSCFVVEGAGATQVPHRAHWQPVEYNALHGGMQRWFAPMLAATVAQPVWQRLLRAVAGAAQAALLPGDAPPVRWCVEAHQFRIDTEGGVGRPTPEGAHRDGVDLVAVFFVGCEGVKGGETRIFDAATPAGQRFTLSEPWSVMLLDDARVIHETTPIQPTGALGWRDTLVLTCRREHFLGDDGP